MKNIQCIALDFDDTLVATRERIIQVIRSYHPFVEFHPENKDWWDFQKVFPFLSQKEISKFIWEDKAKEIFDWEQIELINNITSIRKFSFFCWSEDIKVIIATDNPFKDYISEFFKNRLKIEDWTIFDKATGIMNSQMVIDDDPYLLPRIDNKYVIRFHKEYNKHLWRIPAIIDLVDAIPLIKVANA